jgi:hypothetical protein
MYTLRDLASAIMLRDVEPLISPAPRYESRAFSPFEMIRSDALRILNNVFSQFLLTLQTGYKLIRPKPLQPCGLQKKSKLDMECSACQERVE